MKPRPSTSVAARHHRRSELAKVGRAEATRLGQSIYFGNPCHQGHSGWRYTANQTCAECAARSAATSRNRKFSEGCRKVEIDRRLEELSASREDDYDF